MNSFIVLVFSTETSNPSLVSAWIDVGATVVLLLGCWLHLPSGQLSGQLLPTNE